MSTIIHLLHKYRILVIVFSLPVLVGYLFIKLITPASVPSESSQFKQFLIQHERISISYPPDWIAGETPNGNHGDIEDIASILVPGKSSPRIVIAKTSFPVEAINEVGAWGESRASSRGTYRQTQYYVDEINDREVIVREYLRTVETLFGERTTKCRDLYFMVKEDGFAFSFCTYDEEWEKFTPVFDYIISTIEIQE